MSTYTKEQVEAALMWADFIAKNCPAGYPSVIVLSTTVRELQSELALHSQISEGQHALAFQLKAENDALRCANLTLTGAQADARHFEAAYKAEQAAHLSARARVKELEAVAEKNLKRAYRAEDTYREYGDEIQLQTKRIAELEALLKPFADEAASWSTDTERYPDSTFVEIGADGESTELAEFTLGDLRRAAEAMKNHSGETAEMATLSGTVFSYGAIERDGETVHGVIVDTGRDVLANLKGNIFGKSVRVQVLKGEVKE